MRDIRTHLKLAGLICGTGLALAAMLACGLNLWLKSAAGAATALELVNRSLPGRIDAVRIRIELFAGHIELDDASLSGPDGRRIIGCPRISLDLDLLALLGRRLVISRLELAGPQARLILEDDGQLNLVKAFKKPDAPKSDFVVEINQLQAAAADVRFESAAGRLRARASQTELKLAARFGDGYRLDLAVPRARLSLSQARHDFELGTVATTLRLSPAGLNDLSFNASRGASRLRLEGSLMNPGQRLKARLDFDLAPRDFYPSLEPAVPGRFSGWLTAGGSLVKPELATAIRHSGGDFKGFKLGPAELKAELNNRLLRLDLLKAGYASGLVTVKGQADLGQAWPADGPLKPAAIAYRLNLAGADLALDGLPKIPRQLNGRLEASAAVNGRGLESLSFAARLKARGLSWSGRLKPTGLDLNASGAYAAKRLELKRLTIAAPGASLEGRGHFDTASKNLGAELELTSPDLASLLSPCGLKARGSLGLAAGLSGNLKAPRASFALIGRALGNERLMLGDVSGRARLEPTGWLEVDELELDNRGSRLKATGRLRLFDGFPHLSPGRQFDARAEALDLNPQDFYAASPVAARLNGTLALNACSTQDIRGAARLTGHNLAVRGHELGRLDLTAALADDWLELAGLNLASNSSTLNAHGRLRLTRANLRQSELAELKLAGRLSLEDFDPHCRGALDLDADLSGRLAEPQGQASVSASALEIHGQALAGLHLDATLADQRLNVPNLRCDLGAGHALEGSGWLELNGDYALRAISQNLRLEDLAVLDKAGLTGALTAELSGQGRLKDPSLQLNLTASDLRHTPSLQPGQNAPPATALPDASLQASLASGRLRLSGRSNFDLSADYELASRRYRAQASCDQTALAPWFAVMGLPRLAGEVSGRIEAEGQNLSLRELKARAMVRAFDIDQAHRNILSARDFGLSLDQGRLNLPPTRFNLAEEGRMDLSASGEVPESLKLTATGDIPATVLGAFGEAFEDGSGRLMFTARSELVRGKPRLTAEILIKDLGATLTYNGQRLQAVNGRAVIDGNLASLSELSGRLDGGSFTATGTMALDGLKPRNLALKAQTKALPVELPETMDLKLDSRLSLTADEQRARLDGLVAVTEGTYYKDLKADLLSNMLGSLVKPAATKPRPTMDDYPWLGRTSLDIDLVRRGSLKVENNLAELELNPDLKLGGTLASPVVSGRVSVTGGSVTYQGREFTVKRGNVDFLNPNHTEARVDIQSQTVVGEYAIELDLEGPLDALVLSLSSEPAASQSDILSLLLLGKTSAQLADSDESVGLSPAGMLAELLSSTYADEIKATTSLDVFKLESDSFASSGTGNLKLTMGKELSRRLSLRYELETRDNVSSQRGIAEYKLLDTLYLNGYQGSSGTFGADLQYRYEFR